MKPRSSLLICQTGLLTILFVLFPLMSHGAGGWKAGVASVIITPAESIWMSGYASRDHPAEGTRTELWAKALALEDDNGIKAILITLDLVGIHRELSLAICQGIMSSHDLSRSQIILNCSHTHTGPVVGNNLRSMYFFSDADAEKVDRYTNTLETRIIQLASDAFDSVAPATLSYAEGQATFATNRRNNPSQFVAAWRAAGKLNGPVDYSVPVLRIGDEEGALKAVVFGYACHATTLNDYQWSGDYPGYAQQALEDHLNGVTALFWAGCGADINPLPRRKPELAEKYGRDLAEAVYRTLQGVFTELDPQLNCSYEEIDLAFDKVPTRAELESDLANENQYIASRAKKLIGKLDQGEDISEPYPYPIGVWKFGNQLTYLSLGGEVVVDYALRLRRELGPDTWIAGYSHDVMAYIPSYRVWTEGGYEGATAMIYYGLPSRWASSVEDVIIQQIHRQVEVLAPRQ